MKKGRGARIAGGVLLFVILLIIGQQLLTSNMKADAMTKEEAQKLVLEKYSGEVKNVVMENNQYTVDLERDTGTYKVEIDAISGEILSLIRIGKKAEQSPESPANPNTEDKEPAEKPKSAPTHHEELPKTLTENEAILIATGQVAGEVDDVELESINGISFYFIEIETKDGEEATIQINAITGEVKSITWDD